MRGFSFSERLRNLRGRKYSQAELAEQLGVSTITIHRWENEQRIPSAEKLRTLAEVLNTTVGYLTGETDDPSPQASVTATQVIAAPVTNASNTGNVNVTNVKPEPIATDASVDVALIMRACDALKIGRPQDIDRILATSRLITTIMESAKDREYKNTASVYSPETETVYRKVDKSQKI